MIVFTIYSAKLKELPAQAQENLLNYVKGGKGFFVQHLASASFPQVGRSSASSAAASG